jgi:tetrapyrrole methylase family protein/MazG family protein
LIRRHPHIFAGTDARTAGDVKKRWDEIKKEEKAAKGADPELLLESISRSQPALAEASHIHSRAANAGFDWGHLDEVIDKLHEELEEVRRAGTQAEREHEIGDLIGVVVNLARFLEVDPEQALRRANARFRRRFTHVEKSLLERGKKLADSNIDEMELLWQEAKRSE